MSMPMTSKSQSKKLPHAVSGEVRCALTGKRLRAEDAYWAPPLVTVRELLAAVTTNATRTPSNLSHILFDEQADVPYDPDVRELLASRRTAEQVKLLGIFLLIAAIIIVPIVLLAM